MISGDYSQLAEKNKKQLESWNTVLEADKK
jgi:hypothetical protein